MLKKLSFFLFSTFAIFFAFIPSAFAQAQEAIADTVSTGRFFAAAIAIGVAALGGAIGQGKAAAGAYEGIARNPSAYGKIFTPMIIGLALIESLVIYALLIALLCIFI